MERESVLLGYNVQRSLMMTSAPSTSKPFGESDVDFNDVYGGPPRRFSMQEFRRSGFGGEEGVTSWPGLEEKPVFGENLLSSRRRCPSDDFFDDIFGGGASVSSSPVQSSRDGNALLASPGARLLSPLPPKVEPLGSSSLLPKFSLPAKSKGMEISTFGSSSRKNSYTCPSGIPHSYSSGNSLSRFSSEVARGSESPKPDSSHQLSSLFKETPLVSHDKSPKLTKTEKVDASNGVDSKSSEKSANSSSHFHFSIYKWASKGVPLDLPLKGKSSSKSKNTTKPNEHGDSEENVASKTSEMPSFDSSSNGNALPNVPSSKIVRDDKIKPQAQAQAQRASRDKPEEKSANEEAQKDELRTIRAFLSDHDLDNDLEETEKSASGTNSSETPVVARTKSAKKQERENASSVARDTRERNRRSKAMGRVTEFVKIFNQETAAAKPRDGLMLRSRSCKWNSKLVFGDEASDKSTGENEKPQAPKANDDLKQSAKVYASVNDCPSPNCDSNSNGSKVTAIETEESFNDQMFQVQELTQDENDKLGVATDNKEFKEIDAKIRQWTKGKEGNIRSLLSTLQYVLWAESGWKAVPLMNIIEGNAVKRAYQRALLCLHPDKLQQKGASSHQKYMAEKVFDVLQDAWNYYNSLGAV